MILEKTRRPIIELATLKQAAHCCINHIETSQDIKGQIFCHLNCHHCTEDTFCLKIKRGIEQELNMRTEARETLA
jgi:hypothetical protein